ncbi:MAG TPA: acylphosphatase [Clostridiales bacterium]|nr:acylphosphatase [Clostridiales bacterium]
MNCFNIIAMRLQQRTQSAPAVQETLTRFGCNIKMRLGLHDVSEDFCSNDGLVLLQVCGEKDELDKMLVELNEIKGVKAKMIDLDD